MKNKFGERLLELRQQMDLSQNQLADALGISVATIVHYEKKRRQPDADMIIMFAKFFRCSSDYLLGLTDNKDVLPGKSFDNLPSEAQFTIREFVNFIEDRYKK